MTPDGPRRTDGWFTRLEIGAIAKQIAQFMCEPWLRSGLTDPRCEEPQHLLVFLQLQREFRTSQCKL